MIQKFTGLHKHYEFVYRCTAVLCCMEKMVSANKIFRRSAEPNSQFTIEFRFIQTKIKGISDMILIEEINSCLV